MKNPVAGTFRSLRSFNFRLWTVGGVISNVGTWMQARGPGLAHYDYLAEAFCL